MIPERAQRVGGSFSGSPSARFALGARMATDGYVFLPRHRCEAGAVEVAADLGKSMALWDSEIVQHLVVRF